MGLLEVFLIGLGLAMDASAVSMSNTLTEPAMRLSKMLKTALFFGVFQGVMPLIGFYAGSTFSVYISSIDHWVAFILLALIGGKMLYDALRETEQKPEAGRITTKILTLQAVATSIDALAVGVSFSAIATGAGSGNIYTAVLLIAAVTFVCSLLASCIGKRFGVLLNKKAEIFGGCILILIGLKILLEHLISG